MAAIKPVTLRIPPDLWKAAGKRAEEIGASRTFIVTQALRAYFGKAHTPPKVKRGGSNAPSPFD